VEGKYNDFVKVDCTQGLMLEVFSCIDEAEDDLITMEGTGDISMKIRRAVITL